jgi:hypothetical protein
MLPFTIVALVIGCHIIVARARASYLSHFKFYLGVGLLEGLPLLVSAVFIFAQINYSLLLFILALAFYLFWGTPFKRWREQKARQNHPVQWEAWESKRARTRAWDRIIFLL